jgi:hypothetical protein
MFKVVEDQQQALILQPAKQFRLWIAGNVDAEGFRDGGYDLIGGLERLQSDEENPIGNLTACSLRNFNSQPCFADATHASQGQQAAGRVRQQRQNLGDFGFTSDERCELWREDD